MPDVFSKLFYYSDQMKYTERMFEEMWALDRNLFLRIVFYLRQHRYISRTGSKDSPVIPTLKETLRKVRGRGERKIFYQVLRWMSYEHLDVLIILIPYIPDYGYWKDLLILLGTPAEETVLNLYAQQLLLDYQSFHSPVPGLVSMVAKWTPNEGSSFDRRHQAFRKIAQRMGISRKTLRKLYLVPLRRYLSVTEQLITDRRWMAINYNLIPHRSRQLHDKDFRRNDPERYSEYINRTHIDYFKRVPLPPLVNSILNTSSDSNPIISTSLSTLDRKSTSTMYAIDIAGSMTGFPMTLGSCMCIESGTDTWIPFLFEGSDSKIQPILEGTYLEQITGILQQQTIPIGVNLETCVKLSQAIHKRHLIVLSNILLDISEIPPLNDTLHLTYWSLHLHPITIQDYPNCTIIEGYDLNAYLELREGNILTRDRYQHIIMETMFKQPILPTF